MEKNNRELQHLVDEARGIVARVSLLIERIETLSSQYRPDEESDSEQGLLPRGKGCFVVGLTPDNIVDRAQWLGQTWLKLRTMSMEGEVPDSTQDLAAFADKIRSGGIDVWLWGWPQPDAIDFFVDHVVEVVSATRANGYVLDMEKAWYTDRRAEATELVTRLREATSVPLGLSSYGRPEFHESFPWAELSTLDFGLPQIYDAANQYGDEFPQRCIDDWKAHGFERLVPTLGVNSTSADRMKEMFDNTPLEEDACTWWSFGGLIQSESKCEAMRAFEVPKPI